MDKWFKWSYNLVLKKISGSSTSTGSFGLIETDGDLNISGR